MSLKSVLSTIARRREKPRLYVDACHFDPDKVRNGEAWILFARDEVESIYERVSTALRSAAAVIVIDQGSTDGTPYFAAEAGAVVVMQEAGQTRELALQKAIQTAGRMTKNGFVIKYG